MVKKVEKKAAAPKKADGIRVIPENIVKVQARNAKLLKSNLAARA